MQTRQMTNNQAQPSLPQERLIRLPELLELTSLSRASAYRRIANDSDFPKPIKIGSGNARNSAVGFSFTEVQRWINKQAEKRGT